METQDILQRMKSSLREIDLQWVEDQSGDSYLVIPKENMRVMARFLKNDPQLAFDTLMCLSGVHHLGEPEQMEVVYHLYSVRHRHQIIIKVKVDRPLVFPHYYLRVRTVSDIWPAAEWMEREVYDMFGIHFEGHRDFRRLLLPPDWLGHPLQKDFREQDVYGGISTTRDEVSFPDSHEGQDSELTNENVTQPT